MKHTMLLCAWLMAAIAIHAQQITIKDKVTHQPLEWVQIISKDPPLAVSTDLSGKADVSAFEGTDSIFIQIYGYETAVYSFRELQEAGFTVFLDQTDISLESVVISATRWKQEKKEIPNKITVIRPQDVALQNPQTAADLLATSGEVYIQKSQQGGGSPMIRGFATNRVLIAVDGVRMNTAIFRSGNVQNVISLDPFAIEKTEVLFGPGSIIYGSDAIGGVMNFYTLTPRLSGADSMIYSGNGLVRTASANFEKTGHLDLSFGWKKWALVSSVTYTDYDDLRMGKHGPDEFLRMHYVDRINGKDTMLVNPDPHVQKPSGYSQLNLMQKIRFKPNENWDFNYGFHYSKSSDVPRFDRLIEYRNGVLRSAEWYYGPQLWMMNTLNIRYEGKTKFFDETELSIAHQRFEESRHDRKFGNPVLRHRKEEVDMISVNLDLEKEFGEKHILFYGTEAVLNTVGSFGEEADIETGEVMPTSTRYPNGSTWNSYAAYLNHRWKATEELTIQSGLRYNLIHIAAEFDTTFFPFPFTRADASPDALTGSMGAFFQPDDHWQMSVNLSTGFRAPNIDDIGKIFDSEPGNVVVPNPDLQSEYAYNAEAAIARVFGKRVKVDVTGYYTLLNNALVRRDYQLEGQDSILYDGSLSQVQAIQNAAEARVYGIQAGIEIKLPKGFGFSSDVNWQKGEEEDDAGKVVPLRHSAPWFGISHLTYSRSRLKTDLYLVYQGEVGAADMPPSEADKAYLYALNAAGEAYSPGWYTLNLKVMYQLTDHFMISGGVENITDQLYRPYSSGIAGAGRNFIVAVKATW